MYHQHKTAVAHQRHRREIALGMVGQFAVHARIDGEAVADNQKGMAIGRRFRGEIGADDAVGAAAVVDHHRMAQVLAELAHQRARDNVVGAAWRKRHHETQRAAGVALCVRALRI